MSESLRRYLVVDDDEDDRFLFCTTLKKICGTCGCLNAEGGQQALQLLDELPEYPDAIFLDINMPEMSGWECLASLRQTQRFRDIPVIMFSTSARQRDVNIAYDLGATCYCVKPDGPTELKQILQYVDQQILNKVPGIAVQGEAPQHFQFI